LANGISICSGFGVDVSRIGFSQTVGMTIEDQMVEESIASGNMVLEDQIVLRSDAELIDSFSNPNDFLVPNTSCASCYKRNETRFDLHDFSAFEDQSITESPRVVWDIIFDQLWTQALMER
jgi:hypothetical protein